MVRSWSDTEFSCLFVLLSHGKLDLSEHSAEDSFPKKTYNKKECTELAKHMFRESALPAQCQKFEDIVVDLRRRDSDTTDPTSILS